MTVHGEVIGADPQLLKRIRGQGARAGVSLNPDADIDDYRELFDHLDLFLVMSVYAGFGGQKFMPETLDKVRRAVQWRKEGGLDFEIAIDGGIDEENASLALAAGVDILVAGTAFFKSQDPVAFVNKLRDTDKDTA